MEENKKLKILFVEDQLLTQVVVKHYFENLGHYVLCSEDGIFALELLTKPETEFDCILMDIRMQIMNGLEACEKIRNEEEYSKFQNTPIVAVTAYADEIDMDKCIGVGMNGFITKPIDFRKLKEVVYTLTKFQEE